ncbi:hypothetical protein [Streptomyces peucetius]|uniref:Secreted protein n=1 Tax=Streptomyces peucetius TaxID=1950 RepID=A0ABY6I9B2_STRPE|nr:hypothetical protein [Streptomyces peucetius]UYQ62350.1 hypothetical protein OGH68_13250 [Streptomyces peucetius]
MPRPTAAQLAYGSATVVFSTVALLLLTRTTNGVAVAAIGIASLALGLLVAVTLPVRRRTGPARAAAAAAVPAAAPDGLTARVPAARAHTGAEARTGEHSLRR